MKMGTRLLTVAGLLLALPCFAAPHTPAQSYPYPTTVPTPVFDHDPMSIVVGNSAEITLYQDSAEVQASSGAVPINPAVTHRDPFNKIPANTPVAITVYESADVDAAQIRLLVLKDLARRPGKASGYTLAATNTHDCVIERRDVGTTRAYPFTKATFHVTFYCPDGKPRKFYLVAFKVSGKSPTTNHVKQSSIQTINVFSMTHQ